MSMARGKMCKMKMSDGAEIGVYHVEPKGARRGGLVLIQEIFGITEHIKDRAATATPMKAMRFSAPALFDREAPGLQASMEPEIIQKAIKVARELHPFDLSVKDTQTCIDALKAKGPVFITGYCYGGSVTWAAACRCTGLAAASGYYGSLIPALAGETPKCPTILHFGEKDHGHSDGRRGESESRASRCENLHLRRRPRLQFRPRRPIITRRRRNSRNSGRWNCSEQMGDSTE